VAQTTKMLREIRDKLDEVLEAIEALRSDELEAIGFDVETNQDGYGDGCPDVCDPPDHRPRDPGVWAGDQKFFE